MPKTRKGGASGGRRSSSRGRSSPGRNSSGRSSSRGRSSSPRGAELVDSREIRLIASAERGALGMYDDRMVMMDIARIFTLVPRHPQQLVNNMIRQIRDLSLANKKKLFRKLYNAEHRRRYLQDNDGYKANLKDFLISIGIQVDSLVGLSNFKKEEGNEGFLADFLQRVDP